ncbi:hypothetical protein CFP56_024931 [Quercus suber]|uniref:Uncharacterized protein n=1 Tax=Quercus suber TaxID=58331 RepID=A0AAW0M089_QUESU
MEAILLCQMSFTLQLFSQTCIPRWRKTSRSMEYQDEDLNTYYKSPMKYLNEGFFFNNLKPLILMRLTYSLSPFLATK